MNKLYRYIYLLASVALLAVVYSPVNAEESNRELSVYDIGFSEIEYNVEKYKSSTTNLHAQSEYNAARINHQKNLMKITETAYSTQQVITIFIFVIVSILVLGGLLLSYFQFKTDAQATMNNSDAGQKASFKIGKEGIEFSSSVIGLIVLFMSFFFFHLYVKDVYTIKTNKVTPLALESKNNDNSSSK